MSKRERKTRCWACSSLDVQKWGKRNGHQRFRCNECGIYFTSENQGVTRANERVWFRKWVIERQTLPLLSRDSGLSVSTLQRKFYDYLKSYPQWSIPKCRVVHLVIDGTYFTNKICLYVYRENEIQETLLYRTTTGEYASEIYEDLNNIMQVGIIIESVTCDGHKSAISAIEKCNKWIVKQNKASKTEVQPIVIQRCLVHIQRGCLDYIKKDHQSIAGRRLRAIAMTICKIDSFEKQRLFFEAFHFWFSDNEDYIMQMSTSESGRKWRTHKDIYGAYRLIMNALPDMFRYLENSKIPATSNCIEAYFSHLKETISFHRGLSHSHFRNFVRWYVYFRNNH
ncbi:MAG: hypothetical protein SNF94_00655 [Rikenellaceae bacterium]